MAKNLIDGNSYEFVEGTEKTEHEALDDRVQTLEGQNLNSRVGTLEGQNLDSRITEHTENEDIHLTAAEKAFLNQPYLIGTYFGTGQTERELTLAVEDLDMIIVTASGKPTTGYASGAAKTYTAVGIKYNNFNYCTTGLEFTSTGIKVYNNPSTAVEGAKPYLNETGIDYMYIGFKLIS